MLLALVIKSVRWSYEIVNEIKNNGSRFLGVSFQMETNGTVWGRSADDKSIRVGNSCVKIKL